jgi:hypothetical protein
MSHPARGLPSALNCFHDSPVPLYRLQDTAGDDLGLLEHPSTTVEPGDVVQLPDGRSVYVIGRTETESEELWALLEVLVAPTSPAIPT